MTRRSAIRAAYDAVAQPYAERFWDELGGKHFDRILLRWFASQVSAGETVLELGAGPGEVSAYLAGLGLRCLATDGSPRMIEQGRRLFPAVTFQVEDFFSLSLVDASVQAVVAYYAFVNYPLAEVEPALQEVRRVLKPGGLFLFTFHAREAEEQVTLRTFLDTEVGELTFHFFDPDQMRALVEGLEFQVVDVLVRHPYRDVEYASKRAYFVLRRP